MPKGRFLSQLLNSESFSNVEFPIGKMPQDNWTNIATRQHSITYSRLDRFLVSDLVVGKMRIFKMPDVSSTHRAICLQTEISFTSCLKKKVTSDKTPVIRKTLPQKDIQILYDLLEPVFERRCENLTAIDPQTGHKIIEQEIEWLVNQFQEVSNAYTNFKSL